MYRLNYLATKLRRRAALRIIEFIFRKIILKGIKWFFQMGVLFGVFLDNLSLLKKSKKKLYLNQRCHLVSKRNLEIKILFLKTFLKTLKKFVLIQKKVFWKALVWKVESFTEKRGPFKTLAVKLRLITSLLKVLTRHKLSKCFDSSHACQ